MASAEEYVSAESLAQINTESFAQNVSNFRSMLLRWEKEVDGGSFASQRAFVLLNEVSALQEIITSRIRAAGTRARELGVPPEAVGETLEIYRRVLVKIALKIASEVDFSSDAAQRIVDMAEAPDAIQPIKELAGRIKVSRVAFDQLVKSPDAASLIAPSFIQSVMGIVQQMRDLGITGGADPKQPPPRNPTPAGGGDSGSDLPRRVGILETKVDKIADDISGIKSTLVRMEELLKHSAMKADIARVEEKLVPLATKESLARVEERVSHMPTNAQMYVAGGAALAAVMGVMAKGFGWL
ncbi:hypothetical protein [Acidovorax sp. NB1]|uniref:hypothetical protein n=1 Tax=Acidovorax sp. NB1 TaxID=1943571 RepID=UPI0010D23355|nr:hypothetical protein [Acidovorax sp. NB1]GDY37683.1 hypothetical protein ACINB_35750 [Acidovorax sp. NB1]